MNAEPLTAEELAILPRMRLDADRVDAFRASDVRVLLDIIDRLDRAVRSASPVDRAGLDEALRSHEQNLLALGRTMVEPRPSNWEPLLGERIAAVVNGLNVVRDALRASPVDRAGDCGYECPWKAEGHPDQAGHDFEPLRASPVDRAPDDWFLNAVEAAILNIQHGRTGAAVAGLRTARDKAKARSKDPSDAR